MPDNAPQFRTRLRQPEEFARVQRTPGVNVAFCSDQKSAASSSPVNNRLTDALEDKFGDRLIGSSDDRTEVPCRVAANHAFRRDRMRANAVVRHRVVVFEMRELGKM